MINCDNTAADEISVSLTPYSYSDGEQFNGNIYIASSFDGLDFTTIPAECQMTDGDSSLPLTPVHITGGGGCEQLVSIDPRQLLICLSIWTHINSY